MGARGADGDFQAEVTLPAESGTDLDQRLLIALERISHVSRTLLWRHAYSVGVSPIQGQLLLHLEGKDQAPRVADLAAEFDISAPTISDALAALRRKGLVERTQGERDRRSVTFTLTPEGERVVAGFASWADPLAAQLPGFTQDEKTATLRLLLTMLASMNRQGLLTIARTCLTCRFFAPNAHPADPLPHHCLFLDNAFADAALRVDCAEHRPADDAEVEQTPR